MRAFCLDERGEARSVIGGRRSSRDEVLELNYLTRPVKFWWCTTIIQLPIIGRRIEVAREMGDGCWAFSAFRMPSEMNDHRYQPDGRGQGETDGKGRKDRYQAVPARICILCLPAT